MNQPNTITVISALLNPFLIITFALFCGVTIPYPQIPAFWRAWLFQLDPFTRLIGGMVVTELHDRPVVCAASELNHFNAPAGQTCGEYMNEFFAVSKGAGYIVDNATSACSYCAYKVFPPDLVIRNPLVAVADARPDRSVINSTKAWASNSIIDGEILEFLRHLLGVI